MCNVIKWNIIECSKLQQELLLENARNEGNLQQKGLDRC